MSIERRDSPKKDTGYTRQRVSHRSTSYIEQSRSKSFGEWFYDHRVGIFTVIVVFVFSAVTLAATRYHVKIVPLEYLIEIVPEEMPEPEQKRITPQSTVQELEERMEQIKVQNLISNDASESEGSSDGSSALDAETREYMDKIAADRAQNYNDYMSGLRSPDSQGTGEGGGAGAGGGGTERGKFTGAVTVAYEFKSPVRHHTNLYVPAYRAEGAGEVVVKVAINRNGEVLYAEVLHTTNQRLNAIALAAAKDKKTKFAIDSSAPERQVGTITYTFVAQ